MVSKTLILAFCGLLCSDIVRSLPTAGKDWDFLLFSQSWPVTTCKQWKGTSSRNTCSFPSDSSTWIVHGIWPTKTGTKGPGFCSTSETFDHNQLNPLINELEQHWTNVHANSGPLSFWKHEWDRHGTCAASLPQLRGVKNYFGQGINWNKQYSLSSMLAKAGIHPGNEGYTPQKIWNAIKSDTGKNPAVQCVVDRHTKQSLLSEIRICFDKAFKLIDCNLAHTNCNANKPVMYYSKA